MARLCVRQTRLGPTRPGWAGPGRTGQTRWPGQSTRLRPAQASIAETVKVIQHAAHRMGYKPVCSVSSSTVRSVSSEPSPPSSQSFGPLTADYVLESQNFSDCSDSETDYINVTDEKVSLKVSSQIFQCICLRNPAIYFWQASCNFAKGFPCNQVPAEKIAKCQNIQNLDNSGKCWGVINLLRFRM